MYFVLKLKSLPPKPQKAVKRSAHQRTAVTESIEDYLECISTLVQRDGFVSVSAVADSLKLIRPSVSLMIKRLDDLGYLKREPYRGFALTAKGREIAQAIEVRHLLLSALFTQLGLDPVKYYNDIEGIEHHISDATLKKLQDLVLHLKKHPL